MLELIRRLLSRLVFSGLFILGSQSSWAEQQAKSGELFLVRGNGEAVPLADVEVIWFSRQNLEDFRDEGVKLGIELRGLAKERENAITRLTEMRQGLTTQVRGRLEQERTRQSELIAHSKELSDANGDMVAKIRAIKSEQDGLHAKEVQQIAEAVDKLENKKRDLGQELRQPASLYGQKVIDLFKKLSITNHIGYEEFAHTDDSSVILNYITREEVNTRKYDQVIRKAYSYSKKQIYFPGIYSKITAFSVEREKFHQLLDDYLEAKAAAGEILAVKLADLEGEVSLMRTQLNKKQGVMQYNFPAELLALARQMDALENQQSEAKRKIDKTVSLMKLIEQSKFFRYMPWSADQTDEAARLLSLLDVDPAQVGQERTSKLSAKIYARLKLYRINITRTNIRGEFDLPGDAGAVVAFYSNSVIAEGRTFAWREFSAASRVSLSPSNCIESRYRSLEECTLDLIELVVSVGSSEGMEKA